MSADLSQAHCATLLATTFVALPEHRRGLNGIYTLADGAWAAFSVFFSVGADITYRPLRARIVTADCHTVA